MPPVPGTIDLGKFRVVYEEQREPGPEADGYLLQQRAIIRLNEALVKIEQQEDYTIFCDDERFKKRHGKRPSPLQYFIASIGFCMFSQFARLAAKADVLLSRLEMDVRMTYDVTGRVARHELSQAAQGLSYIFRIDSPAPAEKLIQVAQGADKGCHTVNSMRKRIPVLGRIVLNEREFTLLD
jgi:uncharacterized OsmC-like protein